MSERSYLAWVGAEHYPTIDDFTGEAEAKGVLKRLPNLGVARGVAKPGTVVYLAHAQGQTRVCLACAETVDCPKCVGPLGWLEPQCSRCKGLGGIDIGTGGYAVVDGERWDYTRYIKLKRNTTHSFWKEEHEIGEVSYCRACGGRGATPVGIVFARLRPKVVAVGLPGDEEGIEYVSLSKFAATSPHRDDAGLKAGYYAEAPLLELLDEPIPYEGKHFRGVKRWEPDLEVGA